MKDGNDGTFSSSGIQKRSSTKRIEKKKKKFPRRTVKSNNIKVIEMMIMK